ISEQPTADDSSLRRTFAKAAQLDFARHVAERLGYDLRRGRLDLTLHPFSTRFSADDVRITTRVSDNDFGDALFSTLHEAGHAMYEQGISPVLDGTPLGHGVSAGVPGPRIVRRRSVRGCARDMVGWYLDLLLIFAACDTDQTRVVGVVRQALAVVSEWVDQRAERRRDRPLVR